MDLNLRDLLTIRRSLRQLRTHNRKGLDLAQQAMLIRLDDHLSEHDAAVKTEKQMRKES